MNRSGPLASWLSRAVHGGVGDLTPIDQASTSIGANAYGGSVVELEHWCICMRSRGAASRGDDGLGC